MPSEPIPIVQGERPTRWHWSPDAEAALRRRVAKHLSAAILESGPSFGDLGRWSIFAWNPQATFIVEGDLCHLQPNLGGFPIRHLPIASRPMDALRQLLSVTNERYRQRLESSEGGCDSRLPFQGGWIGCIGYDFAPQLERLPRRHGRLQRFFDQYWAYYDEACVIDRREGVIHYVSAANNSRRRFDPAPWLKSMGSLTSPKTPPASSPPKSDWTKAEYLAVAERLIEYIRAGDVFQANLTQRFSATLNPDWVHPNRIVDLWERCVTMSPAPFAALLRTFYCNILSTSPERFLLVEPNGRVETRPIKGTRPRGVTAKEDLAQMTELLSSAKDRAELAMIVDLERNDLGRVCEFGSVKVAQHAALESFSNVHHLVSTVEGKLRDGMDVVDLLAAAFPGGSITGAPKIRAMEIIDELEACSRGVYTGAIGYISDHGRADFNIAIRTLVVAGDQAHYHVGGGITEGSDPESEYEETLAKGSKLMRVLTEAP